MGAIISSSVAALGSGYSANDALEPNPNGDFSNLTAALVILTVDGSGVPLTYSLPDEIVNRSVNRPVRGCGYVPQFNVPCFGGTGSGFQLNILAVGPDSDATHGRISGLTIASGGGGSGYALNDTGLIVQGGNNSAIYRVAAISGGVVTQVTGGGSDGYAVGAATSTPSGDQPGSGSGLTFNVTAEVACSAGGGGGSSTGYVNRVFGT